MKKHANISIFVPHLGCPHRCSFCNQHYISGKIKAPEENDIIKAIEIAEASIGYNPEKTELAFFGGSFTAIPRDYMLSLLNAAYCFIKEGKIRGIRISTRPDAIDDEILMLLKEYGVTAIELGAQSMDDYVLSLNHRGHTSNDVKKASKLIKKYGFSLGLQMMTGLYGDRYERSIFTAKELIKLKPETVRIYPTIVFEDTYLGELYKLGMYIPESIDDAVKLSAQLLEMFTDNNISVIRTGLHTINEEKYLAGPWHPSFRELCDSEIYYKKVKSTLKEKGEYIIYVAEGSLSKMIGQKRCNISSLQKDGYFCKVRELKELSQFDIKIERVGVEV